MKIIKKEDLDLEMMNTKEITDDQIEFESEKPKIIRIFEKMKQRYEFRNNSLRQVIEFTEAEKNNWRDFEEEDLNTLWVDFQLDTQFKGKEKPSKTLLDTLLKSRFVKKFNPILDFFKSVKWDGKDHIQDLTDRVKISEVKIEIKGKKKSLRIYFHSMLQRWLISAASCGMGLTQNHVMLLFVGGQGTGKTTFLNNLCPPKLYNYLYTGHINPELDKNTADLLAEKFIINIDDQLQSIFNKDFHKIKGLISATSVTNRKAYRRDEKKRDRIANFVGSVNKEKIFEDFENRRYLTFPIEKIDYKKEIDIDQVWAQAYHLLNKGERPWFNSEETEIINAINNHFAHVSQEEEFLRKLYDSLPKDALDAKYVMFSEIYANLTKYSKLRLRYNRVQMAIKKLNWHPPVSKRLKGESSPRYLYMVREKFVIDSYENIKVDETQEYED